jgi:hypothetical protein
MRKGFRENFPGMQINFYVFCTLTLTVSTYYSM